MSRVYNTQLALAQIEKVANYLTESNLHKLAQVVRSTAGEVMSHSNGIRKKYKYNKHNNSSLCEALLSLNYDKNCKAEYRMILGKLLESYRNMTGMPLDDYFVNSGEFDRKFSDSIEDDNDLIDFIVDIDGNNGFKYDDSDEYYPTEETDYVDDDFDYHCDENVYHMNIIDSTHIGDTYDIDELYVKCFNAYRDELGFEEEDALISILRDLVELGYFEVKSRDYINGKYESLIRIR